MDEKKKILVVEDELALNQVLCDFLDGLGYATAQALDGLQALEKFGTYKPDLVLLDVMLPHLDGVTVCEKIRETSGVPIIMLTAKTDRADEIAGLEAGANDYEFKPFDADKLKHKINNWLRSRQQPENLKEIVIGPIHIDIEAHEVRRDGQRISLTPLEFELLQTLAAKPKQVFTREALLEQVWGYQYKADTRLVNVHIQRLRSKIEDDPENPRIVVTERGIGYKAGIF